MSEPDGFREYVMARQASLLRTARLLTGDWQRAEDLVQTALVKVWPRWKRLVAGGDDPDAYVRRVLVTSYLTWRRRRWWVEQPTERLPEVPDTADPGAVVELRDLLARLLPALSVGQRTVLVLRFYEDLSVEQTAELLNCSPGTVKSQTAKALRKLQDTRAMGGIR